MILKVLLLPQTQCNMLQFQLIGLIDLRLYPILIDLIISQIFECFFVIQHVPASTVFHPYGFPSEVRVCTSLSLSVCTSFVRVKNICSE